MPEYTVIVYHCQDYDDDRREIARFRVQAPNKIRAVDAAADRAKKEMPDYGEIRHDIFYSVRCPGI